VKTKRTMYLLAVSFAAMALNISTSSAQVFSHVDALNNRAVAASPRAREEFPWLTRNAVTAPTKSIVAELGKNRAFATSPRAFEQFPELARPAQPQKVSDGAVASTVIKNKALATRPRAKEEFP